MPRGYIVQENDTSYTALYDKLLNEWKDPQDDVEAPIIIETDDSLRPQQAPTHLYVIWKDWLELPQQRRSKMMLEVYEQVRGRAAALNVSLAMGLTPDEAQKLGIHYGVAGQ